MKKFFTIALMFAGISLTYAQSAGKVHGKIFSNFNFSVNDKAAGFGITRTYFGYKYQYNDDWSAKLTLDVGGADTDTYARTAYLKVAALQWKATDKLTVNFGQVGLKQFKTQEKNWGYRYIAKSSQDKYKMGTSADMGLTADYKLHDMVSVDLTVVNGEGYKKNQTDANMKTSFGLTLKPADELTVRIYTDVMSKSDEVFEEDSTLFSFPSQNTMALFVGYKAEALRLGAEYNTQSAHGNVEGADYNIVSAYGTYYVNDNVGVFARYDMVSCDEGGYDSKNGDYMIAGLEYRPVKGVSISVNLQGFTSEEEDAENSIFMNLQYKF
jgi:hypothetical protein